MGPKSDDGSGRGQVCRDGGSRGYLGPDGTRSKGGTPPGGLACSIAVRVAGSCPAYQIEGEVDPTSCVSPVRLCVSSIRIIPITERDAAYSRSVRGELCHISARIQYRPRGARRNPRVDYSSADPIYLPSSSPDVASPGAGNTACATCSITCAAAAGSSANRTAWICSGPPSAPVSATLSP